MDGWPDCAPDVLARAFEAVARWLKQNQLKLNLSKMGVLCLGQGKGRMGIQLPALDGVLLTPVPSMKSLGVTLDASLFIEAQVTNTAQLAFYHLCQIRQLALYLTRYKFN